MRLKNLVGRKAIRTEIRVVNDFDMSIRPEEERQQKTKALLDELDLLSEPIQDFLRENFDPMCQVVIDMAGACVTRSEMGTRKDGKRHHRVE